MTPKFHHLRKIAWIYLSSTQFWSPQHRLNTDCVLPKCIENTFNKSLNVLDCLLVFYIHLKKWLLRYHTMVTTGVNGLTWLFEESWTIKRLPEHVSRSGKSSTWPFEVLNAKKTAWVRFKIRKVFNMAVRRVLNAKKTAWARFKLIRKVLNAFHVSSRYGRSWTPKTDWVHFMFQVDTEATSPSSNMEKQLSLSNSCCSLTGREQLPPVQMWKNN